MQISVLVEPVAGNGYRAKGAEPFGFSAEGASAKRPSRKFGNCARPVLAAGRKW